VDGHTLKKQADGETEEMKKVKTKKETKEKKVGKKRRSL